MARTTRQILDLTLGVSKKLRYAGATSWQYLKVEAVPPLTQALFNGAPGQKLESIVGNLANTIINGIENKIKQIDAEAERKKREIAAAIKAREEKAKAEAQKKEAERLKAQAKKAAEAVKKAKEQAEKTKGEEAKAKPKAKAKPQKKAKTEAKPKPKPKKGGKKK
ncbi:tol-Pal system protein TolA-like [Spodoptera frugiperda]|uniref:Tol-Pal system protein TolA-like n=1 Tax=Spodoptera frugiperda TaxID=7108 RepID=A0A9R0CVE8_SPOFR|nr:tol-Pal system protein TolA-like [Spodoptera frugiperda]